MSKFEKRLQKVSTNMNNAVVIGSAFGNFEKLLTIYRSVFLIGTNISGVKAKNLIFKEDFHDFNSLSEISAIFFDLNHIDKLDYLQQVWTRHNSLVIVEGNDPIERQFSKPLYATGWGCTKLCGFFHVWERYK
jgi:hypothetical protein